VSPARVAHLITRLDLGGAQQNTLYCVAHHDRDRFAVSLFAGPGGDLDEQARSIPDAEVHMLPSLRHPISPVADLMACRDLARLLRHRSIDVVHTHCSKAGIIGRLAARMAGVRVIIHTAHGWSFNQTQPRLTRACFTFLERAVARWSDGLICVAVAQVQQGLDRGIGSRERYRVIRSGIDVAAYARSSHDASAADRRGELRIGTIACLKPQKDPLTLIRAAQRVLDQVPHVRFFIAGDGVLRPEVEDLVQRLGIAERVCLRGWVNDIPAFLHSLDLFVLTSRFEGLPRAVLQAAAAHVPVVATAVDGTPEFVVDGVTGFLAAPGDHRMIADRLLQLIREPTLGEEFARAAATRLTGSYEISQMLEEIEATYTELLAAKSRRRAWVGEG